MVKWQLNQCFGFEIYEEQDYSRDASLSVDAKKLFDCRLPLKVNSCLKLRGLKGACFVPAACAVEPDR